MECGNPKEEEFIVHIEGSDSSDASESTKKPAPDEKWLKKSLDKLAAFSIDFDVSVEPLNSNPPVEGEKVKCSSGKIKKSTKPPRPPKGPSLDAADMRLVKEISKIALKKRERIDRLKALKKIKSSGKTSPISSSLFSTSSGSAFSAMVITVVFFLILIFQGFSGSSSSYSTLMGAPQPAQEMTASPISKFEYTV